MHPILLKDQANAYEALRMQKERLKAELHNATYQAFVDKGVIESGLSDLEEMKALIQGQLQVLSDSLSIRMTKLNRFNADKERSLEELRHIEMQKSKQESVMESIIASSIQEHNDNVLLSSSLGDLKTDNKSLSEQKRRLRDTLDGIKRKIINTVENVKTRQLKNAQTTLQLKSIELKNRENKSKVVNLAFEIQQSALSIQKVNGDTYKFKNYCDKLKVINSDIDSEYLRAKSDLERLENEGHLTEKETSGVESDFQERVAANRRTTKDNQVVTAQNHNLYESNNLMILQESNSKQVLTFLSEMNIKLRAVLSEKQIVNKQTQSVLGLPLAKSPSRLTNESRMDKSLGSTGASFF